MSSIPDCPTSRGQQGVPELMIISRLTDLCESAPFLYTPPPRPAKNNNNNNNNNNKREGPLDVFLGEDMEKLI